MKEEWKEWEGSKGRRDIRGKDVKKEGRKERLKESEGSGGRREGKRIK